MNEIEKLYENAGVEKFTFRGVKNPQVSYPPFTAEKQIELVKWIAVKGNFDSSIDIAKNTYDYWTIYFQGIRWTAEGFEESLAGLINNLWQDLTKEEKEQIRSVLNGN